jgi:hypothetical protein
MRAERFRLQGVTQWWPIRCVGCVPSYLWLSHRLGVSSHPALPVPQQSQPWHSEALGVLWCRRRRTATSRCSAVRRYRR